MTGPEQEAVQLVEADICEFLFQEISMDVSGPYGG